MNNNEKATQNALNESSLAEFEELLIRANLTDEQVQILVMFFKGKSIGLIADQMRYSKRTIHYKKKKALRKIAKIL